MSDIIKFILNGETVEAEAGVSIWRLRTVVA